MRFWSPVVVDVLPIFGADFIQIGDGRRLLGHVISMTNAAALPKSEMPRRGGVLPGTARGRA
jgi:hypothetical protein